MTDIDTRAQRLVEAERQKEEEQAEREKERAEESRLADARRRIKAHDAELSAERARRDAAAEADDLASELHDRGERLQEFAEGLRSMIEGYVETRKRLQDARRRAGHDTGGRWGRANSVLVPWHRAVFGGHDSVVGVEGELAGTLGRGRDRGYRTLAERDPLASAPQTNPDDLERGDDGDAA